MEVSQRGRSCEWLLAAVPRIFSAPFWSIGGTWHTLGRRHLASGMHRHHTSLLSEG